MYYLNIFFLYLFELFCIHEDIDNKSNEAYIFRKIHIAHTDDVVRAARSSSGDFRLTEICYARRNCDIRFSCDNAAEYNGYGKLMLHLNQIKYLTFCRNYTSHFRKLWNYIKEYPQT